MNYFTDAEVEGLDPELVELLNQARGLAGVPFVITSGRRSEESNQNAVGVKDSAHLKGLAVDLRARESLNRFKILRGLICAGFERIGLYDGHIHADIDTDKIAPVCWLGGASH